MKHFMLVAALLVMLSGTAPAYDIVNTTFENAILGQLLEQSFDGGRWYTPNWTAHQAYIIDDPTGAGKGQVLSFAPNAQGMDSQVMVSRTDQETPAFAQEGTSILEVDYYIASNGGDWTNTTWNLFGPRVAEYWFNDNDHIDLWQSGYCWDFEHLTVYDGAGGPYAAGSMVSRQDRVQQSHLHV